MPAKLAQTLLTDLSHVAHKSLATFIETFFAVFVVTDVSTLETAFAAAVAAGVVPLKDWAARKAAA